MNADLRYRRIAAIKAHPVLNGIEFAEGDEATDVVVVHLIKPLEPATVGKENVWIDAVTKTAKVPRVVELRHPQPRVLRVRVADIDPLVRYSIRFVERDSLAPLPAFDPLFNDAQFAFGRRALADAPGAFSAQPAKRGPSIDYLAKDYGSFRQLMLDRLALIAPAWRERSPADLGIMLVELFAYLGDQLSYRQDVVATEAYIDTARMRTSLRRHARLVDYWIDDGENARVWLCVRVTGDAPVSIPKGTQVADALDTADDDDQRVAPSTLDGESLEPDAIVFETLHDLVARPALETLNIYTWGAVDYALPPGATMATLRGRLDDLRPGDVLMFEERWVDDDPHADATVTQTHAVKLTAVSHRTDPLGGRFASPMHDGAVEITDIAWAAADALPAALRVAALVESTKLASARSDITVLRGNVLAADFGRTYRERRSGNAHDFLGIVPGENARFRPRLRGAPLTFSRGFDPSAPSAQALLAADASQPSPSLIVTVDDRGAKHTWLPVRDLLACGPYARRFVVECDESGVATLRFGDGRHGARPPQGARVSATYRIGNGHVGNVGAGTLGRIVTADPSVISACNPADARGGRDPESDEHARRQAPAAYRRSLAAVVAADYRDFARLHPDVLEAGATETWRGGRRVTVVAIDRRHGTPVDDDFLATIRLHLEPYRLVTRELIVRAPRLIPVELIFGARVRRGYDSYEVRAALFATFGTHRLADGSRAFFDPDHLPIGAPIYLSRVYAAAQAVDGVESVDVRVLRRLDRPDSDLPAGDVLRFGTIEKPVLRIDSGLAQIGVLRIALERAA